MGSLINSPDDQEAIFVQQEADAWFTRNATAIVKAASPTHRVLSALRQVDLPPTGVLLDIGGASGMVAEGFRQEHPDWVCRVVEPSGEAIAAGAEAFPHIAFSQGSIAQPEGLPWGDADVVLVSGVFCWVDRRLLSRAICNVDTALKSGGLLVVSDFDPPFLRANPYQHYPGVYTYKQDYAEIFRQMGIYHLLHRTSENMASHSASDRSDRYDCQWVTSVLRKDLQDRYFRPS